MSPTANAALSTWRNLAVGALVALALVHVSDAAAEQMTVKARLLKNVPIGSHVSVGPATFVGTAAYSNYTSSAVFFSNGGATNIAGNTITRLLADDVTPLGSKVGADVREIKFTVANLNASPVSARAHIRFWSDAAGAPGTYYDVPFDVGFDADLFLPTGLNFLFIAVDPGSFTLPAGPLWCGISYDDKDGTFVTSAAQLNNLAQAISGAASVGSTVDGTFLTSSAGSFLGDDNPAGAGLNPGPAHFNLALELMVDETTPTAKSTWSRVKQLYR